MALCAPRSTRTAANSSSVSPASARERPSQATARSSPSGERERGARVAGGGDVGVELGGAGGEALAVVAAVVDGDAVADEQRAGLEEVAVRLGRERVARGDADVRALDVHAGAPAPPRLVERDGRALDAARAELARAARTPAG